MVAMRLRLVLPVLVAVLIGSAVLLLGSTAGALDNPDYTARPPSTVVNPPAGPTTPGTTPSGSTPTVSQPTGVRTPGSASPEASGSQPVRQHEQKVATEVAVRPLRSRMAITGSDVAQTAVVGAVLVVLGAVTMLVRRRSLA